MVTQQVTFALFFAIRYKVAYNRETGACKLEISMTFADDAGEYSIFLKNPHGEASASAGLLEEGTAILLFLSLKNKTKNHLNELKEALLHQCLMVFLLLQRNMKPT